MFWKRAHDFQSAFVVADTQAGAVREVFHELLVVLPTDVLKNQDRARRKMIHRFAILCGLGAHRFNYRRELRLPTPSISCRDVVRGRCPLVPWTPDICSATDAGQEGNSPTPRFHFWTHPPRKNFT